MYLLYLSMQQLANSRVGLQRGASLLYNSTMLQFVSLIPRLFPHIGMINRKERGEPGKHHIGRENMGKRMNSPMLYGQIQSFSCDSFYMVDRMGLDGTMLHYLAV